LQVPNLLPWRQQVVDAFSLNETFRDNGYTSRYFEASTLSATFKRRFSSMEMCVDFTVIILFVFKCLRGLKIAQLPGDIQEYTQTPEWKLIYQNKVLN
jgi:hypothetical protein